MSGVTEKELLADVWTYFHEEGTADPDDQRRDAARAALHELESRADERELGEVFQWPVGVFDAALGVLGGSICNRNGKTRKILDRKIEHCCRTWDDKYGPLNPEQAAYAGSVLAAVFTTEADLPLIYSRLNGRVHHESVHAGFLRRAQTERMQFASVA